MRIQLNAGFNSRFGELYDLFQLACPHFLRFQAMVGHIVQQVAVDNAVVIDLGCGDGATSKPLLELLSKVKVVCVDIAPTMITDAKKSLAFFSERVSYQVADALAYLQQQEAGTAEVIVSGWCLHNAPKEYRAQVFAEINRVLKPGGVFVSADKIALDDQEAHQRTLEQQINAFSIYQLTDHAHLQEEWTQHYLQDNLDRFTEAELHEYVQAGFQELTMVERRCMDVVFMLKK